MARLKPISFEDAKYIGVDVKFVTDQLHITRWFVWAMKLKMVWAVIRAPHIYDKDAKQIAGLQQNERE